MIYPYSLTNGSFKKQNHMSYDNKNVPIVYMYGKNIDELNQIEAFFGVDLEEMKKFENEAFYDEKILKKGEHFFVLNFLFPNFEQETEDIEKLVTSIMLLIFQNKVIVYTDSKIQLVVNSIEQLEIHKPENLTTEILIHILPKIFDQMLKNLKEMKDDIDQVEGNLNDSGPVKPVFATLLSLKKRLMMLSITYNANKKVLDFIQAHLDVLKINSDEDQQNIEYLYDTTDIMNQKVQGYDDFLKNLETLISNMSDYQLNAIMKTLTEISIMLTIPTIIYGFWGINVHLPFEKFNFGVILVFLISVIFTIAVWILLRRKKYL